jgi:hypothetical protein
MRGILCRPCRGIFTGVKHELNRDRLMQPSSLVRSLEDFYEAIDIGCFICTQVKQMLISETGSLNLKSVRTHYSLQNFDVPGILQINVEREGSHGVKEGRLTFRMTPLRPGSHLILCSYQISYSI